MPMQILSWGGHMVLTVTAEISIGYNCRGQYINE